MKNLAEWVELQSFGSSGIHLPVGVSSTGYRLSYLQVKQWFGSSEHVSQFEEHYDEFF